jgi:hypothetical protein
MGGVSSRGGLLLLDGLRRLADTADGARRRSACGISATASTTTAVGLTPRAEDIIQAGIELGRHDDDV